MSWLGGDKNWFLSEQNKSNLKSKDKKKKIDEKQADVGSEQSYNGYAVMYVPIRCPNKTCLSKNIKCYTSSLPVRYHFCRDCGLRFKSIEK